MISPRSLAVNSLVLLFVSLLINTTQALVPSECARNITQPLAVCCPTTHINGQVCGGRKRGHCERIIAPKESVPLVFHLDDRAAWPTRFFSYACQCYGNFFGVSCDECWFGWTGKYCDKRVHLKRKNIKSLSPFELKVYIDVMGKSRIWPSGYVILDESTNWHSDPLFEPKTMDASVQYFITFNHRYGSRSTLFKNKQDCTDYGILDFNHDGVVFPPWHRYFLLIWERMLNRIAHKLYGITDFAMPYWDSAGLKHCDICNNQYIGGPGFRDIDGLRINEHHPFHNMSDYCYEPEDGIACYGCQKSGRIGKMTRDWNSYSYPTQDDWAWTLTRKDYFVNGERNNKNCDSFHMALEGFCGRPGTDGSNMWTHNAMHNMIDGSMCCAATATNDPLFSLHHTFTDKIWSLWQKKWRPKLNSYPNKGLRPGHCRDCFMIGFIPPVRNADMFVDIEELGYTYDNSIIGQFAENGQPPIKV